jgi:hypothetical protein
MRDKTTDQLIVFALMFLVIDRIAPQSTGMFISSLPVVLPIAMGAILSFLVVIIAFYLIHYYAFGFVPFSLRSYKEMVERNRLKGEEEVKRLG